VGGNGGASGEITRVYNAALMWVIAVLTAWDDLLVWLYNRVMSVIEMPHPPQTRAYTPEDVLAITDRVVELVDGQLVEKTMGAQENWIATTLARLMYPASEARGLGFVIVEGFVQAFANAPERTRRPDVLFAFMKHFPQGIVPEGTLRFIPEFVVEVQSPNDTIDEVEARIDDYLSNGAQLVWLVLPRRRAVRVHRADGTIQQFKENDRITGESVLPEFSTLVKDFLPALVTEPAKAG
jgi:Uma2 family endonuclease